MALTGFPSAHIHFLLDNGRRCAMLLRMRIAGRNRAPAISGEDIDLQIVGEVSESDLDDLGLHRPAHQGPPTVQRLRDTHHSLARALAAGLNYIQAGTKTGYTATRVSMLMQDPAFQELVASYRAVVNDEFRDAGAATAENTFAGLALSARMMRDKLEKLDEEGELPSFGELQNNIRILGEFTGLSAAKRTINHNVNANLGDLLAAARARAFTPQGLAPVLEPTPGASLSASPRRTSDEPARAFRPPHLDSGPSLTLPASSSSPAKPASAPEPDEPDGS